EAFLLEVLSEYAVTIPELGTIAAERPPIVVITSNRTRDVHDALKRRCLYHWVEHPEFEREVEIVRLKSDGASDRVTTEVAAAVASMRSLGLYKPPGVAESIDWSKALTMLGEQSLDADTIRATIGTVLKYREDQLRVMGTAFDEVLAAVGRV
ncbi:MAG: MoxR family ATPase, partial [Actinobacteria bacterium]|nr:MoxR family ATPase [Actinomycetota bacterium]